MSQPGDSKHIRTLVPVYVLSLILSACLIFAVQPMLGKMLLPLLGGSPAVWNVAMVFFQGALLAGYAYAHLLAKHVSIGRQAWLHLALMGLCLIALPLSLPEGWLPEIGGVSPAWWVLLTLAVIVGGPFFVLAATAPLLQHWFAHTDHPDAKDPYFLYAASNLGSMTSLLAYPFLIEPNFNLQSQSYIWSVLFVALLICLAGCAVLLRNQSETARKAVEQDSSGPSPGWKLQLSWILLAFVPSSLLLGVTSYITTDISAMPLLWVVPLALYLSTHIVVFARKRPLSHGTALDLQAGVVCLLAGVMMFNFSLTSSLEILLHLLAFFLTALVCHGELAALRPKAKHLTRFYLAMSLGGVLGGIFNALLAPVIFDSIVEYDLMLAVAVFLRGYAAAFRSGTPWREALSNQWQSAMETYRNNKREFFLYVCLLILPLPLLAGLTSYWFVMAAILAGFLLRRQRVAYGAIVVVMLVSAPEITSYLGMDMKRIHQSRNFFGELSVFESSDADVRFLLHGTTMHGLQVLEGDMRCKPFSYYSPKGPLGDIFAEIDARPGTKQAADLGLGVGTISAYSGPDLHIKFFEIDPDVARLATNPDMFKYLTTCNPNYSLELGDGRLKIAEEPDAKYELVILDAFTSDNIPMHLLTLEAVQTYMSKLKPDGLLTFNISNRHVNLTPMLAAIADELGLEAVAKYHSPKQISDATEKEQRLTSATLYVTLARSREALGGIATDPTWRQIDPKPGVEAWTDSFSNILDVLRSVDNKFIRFLASEKEIAEAEEASDSDRSRSPT